MHSASLRSWSSYILKTTTVTSFVWRLSGERLRGDAHFHGNHCFPPRASQSQARSNESGARLLIPSPAFVPTEGEVIFTPIQDCCLRKCFVHETTFSCLSRCTWTATRFHSAQMRSTTGLFEKLNFILERLQHCKTLGNARKQEETIWIECVLGLYFDKILYLF